MIPTQKLFSGAGMRYIGILIALIVGFFIGQITKKGYASVQERPSEFYMDAKEDSSTTASRDYNKEVNLVLEERIAHLTNLTDNRINDLFRSMAIIAGILGLVVTLSWMNLVGVARSKASEEFDNSFDEYKKEVEKSTKEIKKLRAIAKRKVTEIQIALEQSNNLIRKLSSKTTRGISPNTTKGDKK